MFVLVKPQLELLFSPKLFCVIGYKYTNKEPSLAFNPPAVAKEVSTDANEANKPHCFEASVAHDIYSFGATFITP